MTLSELKHDTVVRIRQWLLFVLLLGLVGTETELLLLEHYDDPWQYVPLLLIVTAIGVLIWHAKYRSKASIRTLRWLMGLFLIAGFLGVGLHIRGAIEFQREIDPSTPPWPLFQKIMRVKAPPVLAPGVMLQLGLIGFIYSFCDPAARRSEIYDEKVPVGITNP